ncbi:MAG: hypothetical protein GXP32_08775, partial [Kiritimatiellaeota bacterium]|nr:hypothetical protein [Kiritimatiellota bacterium]
ASHGAGIVESESDYESARPFLFPPPDEFSDKLRTLEKRSEIQRMGDAVVWFTINGFFWFPRTLFGIERHLFAFFDSPELMRRMNTENAEWMLTVVEAVCEVCQPDFIMFAEDMSYNNGPMISKDLFDEFMKPYYDIVVPYLKLRGTRGCG